jgi:hypothetical protein
MMLNLSSTPLCYLTAASLLLRLQVGIMGA